MELELQQSPLGGWETVCRTTLEQEETAEAIVPDARPDIWQVLDGQARLLLQRKEAQEGRGEVAGLLKVTVLYQPEGSQGVETMEVTLPFSAAPELPKLTRRGALHAVPRVLSVDVHLLNPRKVLVRVGYSLELEAFQPQNRTLAAGVADPEPWGICQKTGRLGTLQTAWVQEKAFTYQDTLTLPAGRPAAAELLSFRARCTCAEARVIGSKLVFKGEAVVHLLCRGEDGAVFAEDFPLPYSQIMDAGEGSEEGLCHMDLAFTEVTCTPEEGDGRTFQVTLALQAQGVLRREVTAPILTDLYSTTHTLETQGSPCPVCRLLDQGEAPENGRVTVATPGLSGRVLGVRLSLGRLTQSQEGEDAILTQEVEASVLYETGEGPAGASQRGTVVRRLTGQGGALCLARGELLREPGAAPAGEAVEVSFSLLFRWLCLEQGEVPAIDQVQVGEKLESAGRQPSVVLRAVHPGEDLWAVAKACRTTETAILEASGLEAGAVAPGQMLLIPRTVG